MSDFKERREYPRKTFYNFLLYNKIRANGRNFTDQKGAVSKNISMGGMMLILSKFVTLRSKLVIRIKLPRRDKPVKIISKLVWIDKSVTGGFFKAGVKFIDVKKTDRRRLRNCILPKTIGATRSSL